MGSDMAPIIVISNVDLTNHSSDICSFRFDESVLPEGGSAIKVAVGLLYADIDAVLVFHGGAQVMLTLSLYKLLGGTASVFYFDLLLTKPQTARERLATFIKSILLKSATKYICVHKDTADYESYYKLEKAKLTYVPFKANCYESREKYPLRDGGYVLSCGASFRDYDTFVAAVDGLDIPVKIALPVDSLARYHNTVSRLANVPRNVEIVRHDFNVESWYRLLAASKFVVIPIAKEAIQPAGISVYLEAMSMGKAVVISSCPSTNDMLSSKQARLVPRGDFQSLRTAILTMYHDDKLRVELSERGKAYADSLQGTERLVSDLANVIFISLRTPSGNRPEE